MAASNKDGQMLQNSRFGRTSISKMDVHFPVPSRKKKRGFRPEKFSSLFPLPILADRNQKPSFCPSFSGKLEGNHVRIEHSGDAYYLYKMGCFGKGTLSRSLPEYGKSQKYIDVPKDGKIVPLKMMNSRKYLCHLKWREALHKNSEMTEESANKHVQIGNTKNDAEKTELKDDKNNLISTSSTDEAWTWSPDSQENDFPEEYTNQLCKVDDPHPNVFVVNDKETRQQSTMNQWSPVLKTDPYPIHEHLLLTFEEAFFLSYGLGCLLVKDSVGNPMSLLEMWKTFSERRKTFVPMYVAYHYYRSCGWVPKPGLKFGADLILYKEGNSFYHATYSVKVEMVESSFLNRDPDYLTAKKHDWVSVSGLDRMNEHVAKQLLFCYVIKPDLQPEDFHSPNCISSFTIQEMMISRWVPSQDREKKSDHFPEEFP